MRKFYQDYSSTGVVLILCTVAFGFLFRILGLSEISAWGDEIASLFYAENLTEVFKHESHTPLYYVICKAWISIFGKTILSLRYLFISLSFLFLSFSSYLLIKNKQTGAFLGLIILWWLWPTDVIFSRQARHYGLYAELSFFFLVFWRFKDQYSKKVLFTIGSIVQFLHPFMVIPVFFLAIYDYGKRKIEPKVLFVALSSGLPLVLYYALRFCFYGQEKVLSNINWIQVDSSTYLKDFLLLFGGDSFPLFMFYPLSSSVTAIFVLIVAAVFLFKGKIQESWVKFALVFFLSVVFTELASALIMNIRIARYCIFVVPFFLYALIDSIDETKPQNNLLRSGLVFFILISYNVFVFKPWSFYVWDDQFVAEAKETLNTLPKKELVVCGNRYQLDYYFKKSNLTCTEVAVPLIRRKVPFYLFDINGNDKLLLIYIMQEADIIFSKNFHHAILISVEPRK